MGHHISLISKEGDVISDVRFSAWDYNSKYFYDLFDAQHYNGGYSGYGDVVEYDYPTMLSAYRKYLKIRDYSFIYNRSDLEQSKRKRIDQFLKGGMKRAEKDGVVRIMYG